MRLNFRVDTLYDAQLIYTVIIDKKGVTKIQIHKCRMSGKLGIMMEEEFEKHYNTYYRGLTNENN